MKFNEQYFAYQIDDDVDDEMENFFFPAEIIGVEGNFRFYIAFQLPETFLFNVVFLN
jgi:hypothetical protein